MSDLNKEILRWVLLIGAAPIWWPFLRTLWRDFNAALRAEGGLFGRKPGPREMARLEGDAVSRTETLVNEPLVRPGERRTVAMRTPSRSTSSRPGAPGGAAKPGSQGSRAPSARPARFR